MQKRICLGRVPILIYHSVRRRRTEELGPGGELTLPAPVFESQLALLRKGGYQGITCQQLFDHLRDGAALPPRPVLLTFDDGYLDNHTVAGPLLRRFGFRATVFVATDFIQPGEELRPTLDETAEPPERGYCNAAELAAMERSGAWEVQSHTATHDRLPLGPEVVDFHRPGRPSLWTQRLRRPAAKPAEQHGGMDGAVPWGAPVYRSEWAAANPRAWVPAPLLEERLAAHVADGGGAAFFQQDGWREQLAAVLNATCGEGGPAGRYETEEERQARIVDDLRRSRARLEEILGHPVPFVAWPGGGSSAEAVSAALDEAGYAATFGTNRVCAGVVPDLRAIPRVYFRQHYRGRLHRSLRAQLCRGVCDWESGRASGYFRGFVTRRLMALFRDSSRPNWELS